MKNIVKEFTENPNPFILLGVIGFLTTAGVFIATFFLTGLEKANTEYAVSLIGALTIIVSIIAAIYEMFAKKSNKK
jgi:hypothetical protein